MSIANDKSSTEATCLVVEFLSHDKGKVNGPNIYLAWAGAMHIIMESNNGRIWPILSMDLGKHVVKDFKQQTQIEVTTRQEALHL